MLMDAVIVTSNDKKSYYLKVSFIANVILNKPTSNPK